MLENLYTPKGIVALMALILAVNGVLLYQLRTDPAPPTANAPSTQESTQDPAPPPSRTEDEEPEIDRNNDESNEASDSEDPENNEDPEEPRPEENADQDSENQDSEDQQDTETETPEEPTEEQVEEPEEEQASQGVAGLQEEAQPSVVGEPQGVQGPPGEVGQTDDDTPFDSQYGPPPTTPGEGSEGGGSGDSELGSSGDFDPGVANSGGFGGGLERIQVALSSLYAFGDYEPVAEPGSGSSDRISVLPATSGFAPVSLVLIIVAAIAGAAGIMIFRRK